MKQFTVYAQDRKDGGCDAVYIVNFIENSAITYPLKKGWDSVSERVEKGINRCLFGELSRDLFTQMKKEKY